MAVLHTCQVPSTDSHTVRTLFPDPSQVGYFRSTSTTDLEIRASNPFARGNPEFKPLLIEFRSAADVRKVCTLAAPRLTSPRYDTARSFILT
jgi:hypothetical protein